MHFTHGVADDSVVFQSLHQTYIRICQTLYCTISNYNKMGESKYYTNLISLYNKWKQEVDKQNQKLIDSSRTNISPGTIID